MLETLQDITKEEIIDYSMKYVNPGKTQEWIDRGINIVIGKERVILSGIWMEKNI